MSATNPQPGQVTFNITVLNTAISVIVIFMTLLMNKFYKCCHGFEFYIWMKFMPIIRTKFGVIRILTFCEGILSWMVEIWTKNHLVGDNNCNIVTLEHPNIFTRNDNMLGFIFSVGDTT